MVVIKDAGVCISSISPVQQFISSPVGRKNGRNSTNLPQDVQTVQRLLMAAAYKLRKPELSPPAVNGMIGDPPGPDATVAAILAFQRRFTRHPDGQIDPGGTTWKKLIAAANQPRLQYRIVKGRNFLESQDGVVLSSELKRRVDELCQFLIDGDYITDHIVYTQGVRGKATAHRWSTSWNIRKGRVPLANLQALKDGKDEDGNVWYKAEWEKDLEKDKSGKFTKAAEAKLWEKIKEQAKTYYSSNAVAAEGYATTDSKIKPNVHPVTSNHIYGNAMDVSISWRAGAEYDGKKIINGKTTDSVANSIVARFGLSRPVSSEMWHFQLATQAAVNASPANQTEGHPQRENPHP